MPSNVSVTASDGGSLSGAVLTGLLGSFNIWHGHACMLLVL
jgi:hypothetical protein